MLERDRTLKSLPFPLIAPTLTFALVLAALAAVASVRVSEARAESGPPAADGAESETEEEPTWVELDRRPGRGEVCIVCGYPIRGKEVVELRYKGRTFHVAAQLLEQFEDDPDKYFHKMQARAALFDEGSIRPAQLNMGWLFFGAYVLIGLVFAAVCGYVAVQRALPPIPWFFVGLAGNVAGLALVLMTPKGDLSMLPAGIPAGLAKVPTTRSPVACGSCGTLNHPSAISCKGCRGALVPSVQSETKRV